MMLRKIVTVWTFFTLVISATAGAKNGTWPSQAIGRPLEFIVTESPEPLRDFAGKYLTVVYLKHLGFKKIGGNSNATDVAWLLAQGYRVIELDYAHHPAAITPNINRDIIAINDAVAAGDFCGLQNSSHYQTYVLFEGYRIARNLPYFQDDPTVYNTPAEYLTGDSLRMDIIYPANPVQSVPAILSFSYSNSYATYDAASKQFTDANRNQRLNLGYTLAGFNDSFLEGAPAAGMAWAIADHPKYCPWGKGKPIDGPNDAYKSYQTNPDAAQKVKSAVRTLRSLGTSLGLSGKIGIYGFSRGSDAGSMAIGDREVPEFENAGFYQKVSDEVQAAALGPGVFDFTRIYAVTGDGDSNLETRCPWVWGSLEEHPTIWERMGAAYLVESAATAPVLFFYNTDDQPYYRDQVLHFQAQLESLGVPVSTMVDYGTGHSVPQTGPELIRMYTFFQQYLDPPIISKDGVKR